MDIYLFDKTQNFQCICPGSIITSAYYTEEINTAGQLTFSIPVEKRLSSNIFYACINDPDDSGSFLMFKLIKEDITDTTADYTAIESAYDELASYTFIKDKRPTMNAHDTANLVLEGTRWSLGDCPTTDAVRLNFYYVSILEALQTIVNQWGLEVQFQVKLDGTTNQIKQRNVNMYQKLGKRTNKRFEYGSNLLSVKQENDSTGLYTALVGRGKGVQTTNTDGSTNPDDTDPQGYGRRITFDDVEWSTANGNPLNKPKGQLYLEDPQATANYGFPDGHPRIGFVVFENCEDPNELIQLTYNKLLEVERPQVQFSASIANVGALDLGDTIAIIRHDIGIEYTTRVFKVVHNLLNSALNTVELGDNLSAKNSITQQISNIQSDQTEVNNAIDTIVMQGANGNKLYFGTDFPANATNGDVFYKNLENGGTEMYIYDNGWQLVVSTEQLDTIQKTVDEQTAQISQAEQNAQDAVDKADSLVSQVGTATSNAEQALTIAKQGQTDIDAAKSQINDTQQALQSAQSSLNAVQQQAADQAKTIVSLQQTDETLTSQIANTQGDVSGLKQTASSLQTSVQDNTNSISTIRQEAGSLESAISAVNSDNLLFNSDFLTSEPGVSPLTNWKLADGWNGIGGAVQRCMWYGYSALQIGWLKPNQGMYTRGIKVTQPNVSNTSATTTYNLSFLALITDIGVYDVYLDCSYDDTFQNPNTVQVDSIIQTYNNWTRLNWTVQLPSSYPWVRLRIISEHNKGLLYMAQPMLVYGSTTPAQYISSNQPNQKISSVIQTVDSVRSTVQNNTGDISTLKQTANSLQTSVQDNANNISTMRQEAGVFESAISTVNSDNLFFNSDFLTNQSGVSPLTNWKPADGWNGIGGAVQRCMWYGYSALQIGWLKSNQGLCTRPIKASQPNVSNDSATTTYNLSFLLKSNSNTYDVYFDCSYDGSFKDPNTVKVAAITQSLSPWTKLNWTFQLPSNYPWIRMRIISEQDNGLLYMAQPMLVYGSTMPDKYISSNEPNQKVSSIIQTVDSIQSIVQGNSGDISSLKQTATSLQSVVENKADISQVTQLSNVIQSAVSEIGAFYPNGNFDDTDLGKYYIPWDTCPNLNYYSVVTNNKDWGNYMQIQTPQGVINKAITKDYIPINPNVPLVYSGKSLLSYQGSLSGSFKVYMHFYDSNKVELSPLYAAFYKYDQNNVWQNFSITFTPPSNAAYVRIETTLDNSNGSGTYWGALDNLALENGGSIASKITQLGDDINLRVQKGDLLSQINIEAGQTLIQSDKLYLDSSSVVFSGNAFIPSAAITDLSADKITTGTLNAANVNIINLNVANLVGNTTSFVQSAWHTAYGSNVNIDGGSMDITYGDFATHFNTGGVSFNESGEDLGGFTVMGLNGAPANIQGLTMNLGANAEFLAISAKDYGNVNQNPIPPKLIWMRQLSNTYGFQAGWNFLDDVWVDKLHPHNLTYDGYTISFAKYNDGSLALISGNGSGFYWSADGNDAGIIQNHTFHSFKGLSMPTYINSNGTVQSWQNW